MPGAVRVREASADSQQEDSGRPHSQATPKRKPKPPMRQECAARPGRRSPVACQAVRACRRRTRACDRRVWSSGNQTVCNRRAAAQSARPGERAGRRMSRRALRWSRAARAADRRRHRDLPADDRSHAHAGRARSVGRRRICSSGSKVLQPDILSPAPATPARASAGPSWRRGNASCRADIAITSWPRAWVSVEGFGTPGMGANVGAPAPCQPALVARIPRTYAQPGEEAPIHGASRGEQRPIPTAYPKAALLAR